MRASVPSLFASRREEEGLEDAAAPVAGSTAPAARSTAPVGGSTPVARSSAPVGGSTPAARSSAPVGGSTPVARSTAPVAGSTSPPARSSDEWRAELGGIEVMFGVGSVEALGELARELGGRRALLVTDRGVRAAGHAERGAAALAAAGVATRIFDGVEENPTTRQVEAGREVAAEWRADLLVGLGGGSAMDCAKGINFLLTNGGRMEDYQGFGRARLPMLPAIGVPTTAGTGSEAQSYALISRAETHQKMACGDRKARFRIVVLDPALAASAPRPVAAAAGLDALAHAVESLVSRRANPVSRMLSREAWRLLAPGCAATFGAPGAAGAARGAGAAGSMEASSTTGASGGAGALHAGSAAGPSGAAGPVEAGRAVGSSGGAGASEAAGAVSMVGGAGAAGAAGAMLLGAHLAGAAIEVSMLGAAHACANPLTARYGVVHGAAVALMLPHVVRFNSAAASPCAAVYAELDGGGSGAEIAARIEALRGAAGLPGRLREVGVERSSLAELAREAAEQWTAGFNPRPVGEGDLLQLYEQAY
jgi:alcohol dehydrogenase